MLERLLNENHQLEDINLPLQQQRNSASLTCTVPVHPRHAGPMLERLLNENHQLEDINLSNNQLGDAGALSVARSLPYSQWLQRLDLRANNIGEPVSATRGK